MMMNDQVRFEPGICIFVGEIGQEVFRHFTQIFSGIDHPLRESIRTIGVATSCTDATLYSSDDLGMKVSSHPLAEQVGMVLKREVGRLDRPQELAQQGYLSLQRISIHLVGAADDTLMGEALRAVLDALDPSVGVCSTYLVYAEDATVRPGEDPDELANRYRPTYTFVFQPKAFGGAGEFKGFPVESQVNFAMAEALFALVATGIMHTRAMSDRLELQQNTSGLLDHGSLGTSRLIFPLRTLIAYCAARRGASLFTTWTPPDAVLDGGMMEATARAAREQSAGFKTAIDDTAPPRYPQRRFPRLRQPHRRPRNRRHLRPGLGMLRRDLPELPSMTPAEQVGLAQRNQQRTEALKAYETATRKLFECFDQAQVTEQMGRNINWEEALHQQNVNAGNAYATWAASCEQAWTAAAERTGEEIGRDIEQLWLSDEAQVKVTGMQEALQLVKQLEAQVVELVEAMGNLRKLHQEDYEYDRDAFYSAVKDGANEAPGVIRGPNQPGGVSPPGTPVYAGPVFPGQRPPQAQGFGMPTPERAIAGRLGGALRAAEGRVPHPATLIGAGLIALVPLAIIAVTLAPAFIAPATLAAIPYWVGALTGALAALMVIGSGLFRAARRLRVRELRKLLLSFHRTYYAYESEKKEDDQRSGLLRTLAMQLLSMRERLQNPKAFFAKLVALMRKVQGDAHETLFTTGAGGRDVFTADGQILQRDTGYTVAEFSRRLDDEIRARPIVDPDPILLLDDDELKARFLGYLRARGKLLIEMPEDEIAHTFLEFASSHYALYAGASSEQRPGYHHGDIAGPLHDEQVRRLLRSQATILREPGTAPQRHEYLCGQPQEADLFTGAETIVPTHNTDWFMVIRFLDGGGAVDLPDTLFPDR